MSERKSCMIDIRSNEEEDGRLLVVEGNSTSIPFDIKRIFWVRDVKAGAKRGNHATKRTKLVLIPVAGSLDVVVDDGNEKVTYHLDDPTKGLYVDEMLWRTMENFSSDCVVEAVCDQPYAPGDETYEDYEEYLKALGKDRR